MPFGVNWTTSLDGWYEALGFLGVFGTCFVKVIVFGMVAGLGVRFWRALEGSCLLAVTF